MEEEPEKVLLYLVDRENKLETVLNESDISEDVLVLTLRVISKALMYKNLPEHKIKLLVMIENSKWLKVSYFFTGLSCGIISESFYLDQQ